MNKLGLILVLLCLVGTSYSDWTDAQWGYNYYALSLRVGTANKGEAQTDGYSYADNGVFGAVHLRSVLTAGTLMTETENGKANVMYWSGTIIHDDVNAAAVAQDVLLIDDFPAKYKILEIVIDVTEVWDDAGGPISNCTVSAGWTAANYVDLMDMEDVFSVNVLGDAAGELNYTAVQGGIRSSWSATTDLYLRFVATGGNLSTLTTGEATVYIVYQIFE